MKIVNDLTPQNEVKNKASSKDHEHVMGMSALCLLVTVVLVLVPSLILVAIIFCKKSNRKTSTFG